MNAQLDLQKPLAVASNSMPTATQAPTERFVERWFFTGMAIVMLIVSLAGFLPAIVHPAARRAPLTQLAAAHGIAFLAWLLIFLVQSLLVATGHVRWHRQLGLTSVVVLALMIPLAFKTTVRMVQRGFDLSGDSHVDPHPKVVDGRAIELDAPTASAFNFGFLLEFTLLATAAIAYRRRPEVHKRLMLFANISLMGSPIQHFIGHLPNVVLTPASVAIPFAVLILAGVVRDYLVAKRIHPLTAVLAMVLFVSLPLLGAVIGPSTTWRHFAAWLAQ